MLLFCYMVRAFRHLVSIIARMSDGSNEQSYELTYDSDKNCHGLPLNSLLMTLKNISGSNSRISFRYSSVWIKLMMSITCYRH
jgi:hypothetical protein